MIYKEDWHTDKCRKALKLYHSLKCPNDTMDIDEVVKNQKAWNIILSARARGKTTNMLLWALCLHKCYGILPVIIRQRKDDIAPKSMNSLMSIICDRQYNYLEKLTDGKYNTMVYKASLWRYAHIDEETGETEVCDEPCFKAVSVDNAYNYKSILNLPTSDIVIFDEFLNPKGYLPEEFILLCDLLSTIFRKREHCSIYLLGNLVDRHSIYFDELQLNDIINKLNWDSHHFLKCLETDLHIYALPKNAQKQTSINLKYFGFNNPKLTAITTTNGLWAMSNYPRIRKGDDYIIKAKRYIEKTGKYCCMEMRQYEDGELYVLCRPCSQWEYEQQNSIHYISDYASDNNNRFALGWTKTDKLFLKLFTNGFFRYTDNSQGTLIDSYIRDIVKKKI